MPDPMTAPGRQAAIEAAAKAMWETGREPNPLVRAWDRTENEAGKDETRRIVTAAIDAYERALAEQPREDYRAAMETILPWLGLEIIDPSKGITKANVRAAEQPREEWDREGDMVFGAGVRFLNDAMFHAEVHATREVLSRAGIDLTKIKVAMILDCASQARAALNAEEHSHEGSENERIAEAAAKACGDSIACRWP